MFKTNTDRTFPVSAASNFKLSLSTKVSLGLEISLIWSFLPENYWKSVRKPTAAGGRLVFLQVLGGFQVALSLTYQTTCTKE
jgi:hypothetical protein